jgi:TATA-box binding protein (TBP) (component of TFIID and TFIIIB)
VKIFNTGKIEIPGVQDEVLFQRVLLLLLTIIQPHVESPLKYKSDIYETVLINSIFKCGYYINRESLYDILKYKYNIQTIYDPCSYPGIQCKFYYNPDVGIQTGSQISEEGKKKYKHINQVSFMIFRTGSVLIVGKCEENVLREIYEFIKKILIDEYKQVFEENTEISIPVKDKKQKQRKHEFMVDDENVEEVQELLLL